jgi:hypothetical protein
MRTRGQWKEPEVTRLKEFLWNAEAEISALRKQQRRVHLTRIQCFSRNHKESALLFGEFDVQLQQQLLQSERQQRVLAHTSYDVPAKLLADLMELSPRDAIDERDLYKFVVNANLLEISRGMSKGPLVRFIFGKNFPPSLRTQSLRLVRTYGVAA